MKNLYWQAVSTAGVLLVLAASAQVPPAPSDSAPAAAVATPDLSPGTAEVVRLAEAGTSDDVIVGYIQAAQTPFRLTADQILFLRDNGISSPVISAMLARDNALQGRPQVASYPPVTPVPAPAPAPAPAPVAPMPADATSPVYVGNAPADVTYFYNSLSPYGTWVFLDGIGWCWQPRVVAINHG